MADPYREPINGADAPSATSPPSAPLPSVSGEADVQTPPIPEGFIPEVPVGIPDMPTRAETPLKNVETSTILPATPPETPLRAPSEESRYPDDRQNNEMRARPEAAISVMPSPENGAEKVERPLRDIPLQDITVPQTSRPSDGEEKSTPEPVVIMPPPPPVAAAPTPELRQTGIPQPVSPTEANEAHEASEARNLPPSAIRTLQSDIASHVEKNQLSIAQIALAQKEKDRNAPLTDTGDGDDGGGRGFLLGVVSTMLVLAGIVALAFVAYSLRDRLDVPFFNDNGSRVSTIISTRQVEVYDISTSTRAALIGRIESFADDPNAQVLDVRALVFTRQIVGTSTETAIVSFEDFMDAIDSRAPGRLVRTLGPDMMLGALGNEPFLLVPHDTYENAFAGMLEWEPLMQGDLPFLLYEPPEHPTFPMIATTTDEEAPSTATATSSDDSEGAESTPSSAQDETDAVSTLPFFEPAPLTATWKDIVVRNVDARALIREDDELLMLYSFLRGDLLLITARKETMAVILDILATPSFGE